MEPPSPARLYAAAAGALLVVLGIAGFFSDRSWLNFFDVGAGALGLLAAGASSRLYALLLGAACLALGILGVGETGLYLALGVLGLAAAAGTPGAPRSPRRSPRSKGGNERRRKRSEAGAKAAAEGA